MSDGAVISSRQNPRFRAALALRDARDRRAQGRLLVDGSREISQALDARLEVREAWVALDRVRSEAARALLPRLRAAGAELLAATLQLLAALAYGERDDGIVIVAIEPLTELDRLRVPERPLLAVVDGVEKPGNLGAILRSADGAGVDGIIASEPRCDPWNPNVIRASLGTIFSLPLAVSRSSEALAWLRERRVTVVAARLDAELEYDRADLSGALAIVLGAEATGLGEAWTAPDVLGVRIPMLGRADSLNVSASAAVLFYEARRQRRASMDT